MDVRHAFVTFSIYCHWMQSGGGVIGWILPTGRGWNSGIFKSVQTVAFR